MHKKTDKIKSQKKLKGDLPAAHLLRMCAIISPFHFVIHFSDLVHSRGKPHIQSAYTPVENTSH